VQVVVAEQGVDAAFARFRQRLHAAQRAQGIGAAVDQVADEQDARARPRGRADLFQQQAGFMGASLQVADYIGFHLAHIRFCRIDTNGFPQVSCGGPD